MPRRSNKVLEQENKELKDKLIERNQFSTKATSIVESSGDVKMVPVKNYSDNAIVYTYEYRGQPKRLELEPVGRRRIGAVPLEVWYEIERDTKLVTEGYIARTDVPTDNPNVVEDIEALVENSSEADFKNRLALITNPYVLYKFVSYLEPIKNKTGKQLAAQYVVRQRVAQTTGTRIVDDEE